MQTLNEDSSQLQTRTYGLNIKKSLEAKVLNRICIMYYYCTLKQQDFDLITDAVTQCIMLVISAGYMQ